MLTLRGRRGLVGILLLGLLAWFVVWFRSPERRIRREVDRIQELVDKTAGESSLAGLAAAREVTELFAEGFEFSAEPFRFHTRDRRELAVGIHRYRSSAAAIDMRVRDHELNVDRTHRRATSLLLAEFITRSRDLAGTESYRFQVNWVETESGWRIDYVRLLEVVEVRPGLHF